MTNSLRRVPAVLGLLALGAVGLLLGSGARADEGTGAQQARGTWVYDVRVVRVDSADPTVLETAPPWEPAGAAGARTTATWADLWAGLKHRGRATILLDQRSTAMVGVKTSFKQNRKRPALTLQNRAAPPNELWGVTFVDTGANVELVPMSDGLQYAIDVRWEDAPTAEGTGPLGSAEWNGSCSNFKAGETLVLSQRQQQAAGAVSPPGLEIYVLVTGWSAPAK